MCKVLGTENPADLSTKGLNGDTIDKFVNMLNMEHREGRADLAPEVSRLVHDGHCDRCNSRKKNKVKVERISRHKNDIMYTAVPPQYKSIVYFL